MLFICYFATLIILGSFIFQFNPKTIVLSNLCQCLFYSQKNLFISYLITILYHILREWENGSSNVHIVPRYTNRKKKEKKLLQITMKIMLQTPLQIRVNKIDIDILQYKRLWECKSVWFSGWCIMLRITRLWFWYWRCNVFVSETLYVTLLQFTKL